MDNQVLNGLQHFKDYVALKFQLYNSLFTSLPFQKIEKTGIHLSLFQSECEEGYKSGLSPSQIIDNYFKKLAGFNSEVEKADLLFRFIQFIERQVVLFDALEDAAFPFVNDLKGAGTLKQLEVQILQNGKEKELAKKLKDFSVKIVLTAHPTQFYPGSVLGIINDLSLALLKNNAVQINTYLQQLGKTPFFKKTKPTPFDEAMSLIWYLENVFYEAAGKIMSFLNNQFPQTSGSGSPVSMGFWPGGDKDGNPFVTAETTRKVADSLRGSIIKCYYLDIRKLRRRLTFTGIDSILAELENELYINIFIPGKRTPLSKYHILQRLEEIRTIISEKHDGLFQHLVEGLIRKVHVFGLHFASLDVRQESSVHNFVLEGLAASGHVVPPEYPSFNDNEKYAFLNSNTLNLPDKISGDPIVTDAIETIRAIKDIQTSNGEEGCCRYIISQCNSALNVMEVFGLFILGGWEKEKMTVDIVPLFETVSDLNNAQDVMEELYSNKEYSGHLKRRNNTQTIMVGFSDGTKDGGYLMANWGIYKAKEQLTTISKKYGIDVIFFDGRGGPPARGGGKTHKFYASMASNISNKQIQLTIQGQTVSSNFGTTDAAQFYLEQLIHAGISNEIFPNKHAALTTKDVALLNDLSDSSYKAYCELKSHPDFFDYLSGISPIRFYSETNIGSRPASRGAGDFQLKDLRAIPFVGAWSQIKQNVTGFYGVGKALQKAEEKGLFENVQELYKRSLFFKTLIDNCEMAMKKCFFPLTAHLSVHEKYGKIWNMIHDEFLLTEKYLLKLSGNPLMEDYPIEQLSISMRDKIVLPSLTIQQFALARLRELYSNPEMQDLISTYEKLVIRCSFGIINAGRNSA